MYMNLEAVLIIGAFALLATAAGWVRMMYYGIRRRDAIQEDSRTRAAAARQAFKAARQPEQLSAR